MTEQAVTDREKPTVSIIDFAETAGKMPRVMQEDESSKAEVLHDLSLVVPVYQGEKTIEGLADEVAPLTVPQTTPGGRRFRVAEMLLVHDGALDASAEVMKAIANRYTFIRLVWLSRNFGQHPATLAGMASTVSKWVATIDEDGQQDPRDLAKMLDCALEHHSRLVYARPANDPPHGFLRNSSSALVKQIFVHALGAHIGAFNSFRLIEGQVARGVAAYCGANVYLDVALSWVVGSASHCSLNLRSERGRPSGYTLKRLLRHFWQLVLTSGTFPLRLISLVGCFSIVFSMGFSVMTVWQRLHNRIPVQGWTSMIIIVCLFAGLTLVSLGIIAEYLGIAVSMAMGKPPYLIVSQPREELGNKP